MNIDFLKCCVHAQTEEYLNMLFANNILPIITKPTRLTDHTATLIDHTFIQILLYWILQQEFWQLIYQTTSQFFLYN